MEWPRLDLAAQLVIRDQGTWDGGQYYMLPPIAQAFEHEYPLAATVIYRALIDDILARARSKAYEHAARYLSKLETLARDPGMGAMPTKETGISDHAAYVLSLRNAHSRKSGLWSLVKSV